jgi:CubicO group peptidase (beta-lactamase class C family)
MSTRRAFLAFALAVLGSPLGAQQQRSTGGLDGFDQWVQSVMTEWHVPGLAVGAIKDGKVVLARGFGYRDVEGKQPVTSKTLMAIGSNSKSFTVVLMGMLVDEKKLEWERPVRTYLPDFQMYDEFATREMTPKDLVTHRSGLPRHDNVWYGRPFTRPELYQRLRYLEPTASFRSRYQYQNLMFMTAGYLVEKISGRAWDDLIRERIFTPLGMSQSSTSVSGFSSGGDVAYPYVWRDNAYVRLPYRKIDAVGPAGSINSTAEDMLKYIQFRLDQGTVGDRRLLSAENETQMQSPQMVLPAAQVEYPELSSSSYGLGLGISAYRGRKTVGHGGGIDGFISAMTWMPAERIGIVVLTNQGANNPVPTMVTRVLYDRLLGVEPADWAARQRKADAEAARRSERSRQELLATRKAGTTPSHPLSAYEGTYFHPGYGELTVKLDGQRLAIELAPHKAGLEHFHYDVWEIKDPGGVVPFGGLLEFVTNAKGEISKALVPLEPAMAPIEFVRK